MVAERLSKSEIMMQIGEALSEEACLDLECIWSKNGKLVHVKIDIKEREVFVDEHGVRWVRE